MLCQEGPQILNDPKKPEEGECVNSKQKKVPADGSGSLELNSFRNPKTWKKSLSNFFRHQLRSTKSNDGDGPSGSNENFEEKAISAEQKWQSLGKIFRRQSFADHWDKPNQEEIPSHSKRFAVRKVFSSYFGKNKKTDSSTSREN